jgi:hypothetical protein
MDTAVGALETLWQIVALAGGILLVIRIVLWVQEKPKNDEKPKRIGIPVSYATGDDGELTEDWEMIINPMEQGEGQ